VTVDPLAAVESRLQAALGIEHTEDLGTLVRRHFLRFAVATGDEPYLARIAALPADQRAPAPVLYLPGILHWTPGPLDHELRTDGLAPRDAPGIDAADAAGAALNVMHGGQAITFGRTAYEGTKVSARRRLVTATRKTGRAGDFLIAVTTTTFVDGDDDTLAMCDDTILVVPR
jgi:hypothetical protein